MSFLYEIRIEIEYMANPKRVGHIYFSDTQVIILMNCQLINIRMSAETDVRN